MSIDTACSSSLVAVDAAMQAIRSGRCSMALVAGANLQLKSTWSDAFVRAGMLGKSSQCRFGDDGADGYVRGEGVGAVLIQRTSQVAAEKAALVYAEVCTSAVNQDGRSNGLTAPNPAAQEKLLRAAYDGIDPNDVAYVEAHGTGTSLGDPIELTALSRVLGKESGNKGELVVGSVKSNIGHLECAAGIAALIKAALIASHGVVPASLHFDKENHHVDFGNMGVRVAGKRQPLVEERRFIGVSGFGFGGTNAHVVLRRVASVSASTTNATETAANKERTPLFFPLSMHSSSALIELVSQIVETKEDVDRSTCEAAVLDRLHCVRRRPFRVAATGFSAKELLEDLESSVIETTQAALIEPRVCFVFTGQGSAYYGMARGLFKSNEVFRGQMHACDDALASVKEWRFGSLCDVLFDEDRLDRANNLSRPSFIQPALVAIGVSLAKAISSDAGIRPCAVIGHSLGEITASHVSGVLDLESAMRLAAVRGWAMESQVPEGLGGMIAVKLGAEELMEILMVEREANSVLAPLEIAALNSSTSTVLSGPIRAVKAAVAFFKAQGVKCKQLDVTHGFHSGAIDGALPAFKAALDFLREERRG